MKHRGYFITFEGPEGSGKSTLIRAARRHLGGKGFPVVVLREPGGTWISEKIRRLLLDRKNSRMAVETELLLYLAARAQIVRERILPALREGKVVISDRFHDSTLAYQGYGGGIDPSAIQSFGKFVKGGVEPDLTILLDVETRLGLQRAGRMDRIERKSLSFHRRVRRGYLALARKNPGRIFIVRDEKRLLDKVDKIKRLLDRLLGIHPGRLR